MKVLRSMHAMMVMIVIITLVGVFVGEGNAQGNGDGGSECLNQLTPCLSYLNNLQGEGRDPPDSCCDPLKSVIKSYPRCLCNLISNRSTKNAESAGINVTQAQELPARCGQRVNPISCLTTTSKATPNTNNSKNLGYSRICLLSLLMLMGAIYG